MLDDLQNTLAGGKRRKNKSALPFFSSERIRLNIRVVLEDARFVCTPAYSLALQAEHLLRCVDGTRIHGGDAPIATVRRRKRWTDEERLALLRDPRPTAEIAAELGCSPVNVRVQRSHARKIQSQHAGAF